jgi:DNA-binding CsgD family transcriptional regulator
MELIVAGKRNQDIAAKLSINIKTVEAHRANVMRKTGVDSLAELVQLVHDAGAPRHP